MQSSSRHACGVSCLEIIILRKDHSCDVPFPVSFHTVRILYQRKLSCTLYLLRSYCISTQQGFKVRGSGENPGGIESVNYRPNLIKFDKNFEIQTQRSADCKVGPNLLVFT
jgi:hypothetical protein